MKRKDKKIMLISISPVIKEMIRYMAYKSRKSQNTVIEEAVKNQLDKELKGDPNYQRLVNI